MKHPVILTKLSVLTMAETMWPSYSEPKPRQICWRWDLDLRSFNCLSSRHNYYVNYWWQHFYKIWRSYDRSLVRCCTLCDWALWNFITLTFDLVTDALYHYVTPQVISRNEATQTHCYNPVAPAYLIWAYYAHERQRRCHEDPVAPPPPADWRRQLGRPRITRLSTIQQDLKHHHLTLPEAADLAQNRPLWRMMSTYGATQPWVACQKRRRQVI